MSDAATRTRPPTPFKELDFFAEDDASMFAGREREARQLVSRIVSSRAIVVHARSGLGKTSLLRAGVIPRLTQQSFRPVYVRMLDSLLGDLTDAVVRDCRLSPPAPESDPANGARHVIAAAAAAGPLVLLLDQFEEFFTRFERQPGERHAFVQFLTDIVRDEKIDVRVVFSLREDYLYALDEFQRKLPDLFAQAFRLLPLTPLGAREAITRPLVNNKIPYDEALIAQLVDELTVFGFDSARLQVTCSELYRHALAGTSDSVTLKAGDLDLLKDNDRSGLRGIYRRYLHEAVANIDADLHLATKLLLDKLITAKRTKFAISREALRAEFDDGMRIDLVLSALEQQKLVRREPRGGVEWFELRHECLIDGILDWFREDATFDSFRFVRSLIEEHSVEGRFRSRPERLLTPDQLAALLPLREYMRLTPAQAEYVLQSAVYTQSPDLRIWAAENVSTAARLLHGLSASTLRPLRIGALRGIGQIGQVDPDSSALCLALALDPSAPDDVREAARKSAAIVATDSDLMKLESTEAPAKARSYHSELLADLYVAGRMGKRFGRWRRWLTEQYVIKLRARQFDEHRSAFVTRAVGGGLLAGGAVTALIVAGMLAFPSELNLESSEEFGIFAVYPVVLGALLGWRNGAAAFKRSAVGDTRWWKASWPSLSSATTSTGLSGWMTSLLVLLNVYTVLWLLTRVMVAGLVAVIAPVVRRAPTLRSRLVTSLLICVPPLALLGLWNVIAITPYSDVLSVLVWFLFVLLSMVMVDLCSFSLAIPDTGIAGATPVPPRNETLATT